MSVTFPDDEVGRMALHFINAKGDYEVSDNNKEDATKKVLALIEDKLAKIISSGAQKIVIFTTV